MLSGTYGTSILNPTEGGLGVGCSQRPGGARDQGEEGEYFKTWKSNNETRMSKATCKKAEARQGKIYVGKLPVDEISNQDLTDHFSQVFYTLSVIQIFLNYGFSVWNSG